MGKLKQIVLILYVWFLSTSTCFAVAEGLITPKTGTVYHALLEGLVMLADGKVEEWIGTYCDGIRLCKNVYEINNIRQYRAKLQEKIAPTCLRKGDTALEIDRVVGNPEIDIAVKIYLVCDPKGPPRFYSLRKTADFWFFISL